MTPPPERLTYPVHSLVTPTTGAAFELWARSRGFAGVSAAVRALMVDALVREASEAPLGALYSDLSPATAAQIVAALTEPGEAPEA